MTGWVVQLDPPAAISGRAMLDLNSGAIRVGGQPGTSIDWGTAAINSYLAQAGQYGQGQVDWDIPNRTVTIPLLLGADDGVGGVSEEQARERLQQKVGLLQREGGVLLRQRAGGDAAYLDIVYAEITVPDVWGETGGIEDGVSLVLTCLPDFYGEQRTLDVLTSTNGILSALLTENGEPAVIDGDYPARCRIQITDTSGTDRHGMLEALRSRHYDSAPTAALVYEAENLTPMNGAVAGSQSGASGGNAITLSTLPPGLWVPMLATNLASGSLMTHTGSYKVCARVYATGGQPDLQLAWGAAGIATPRYNDQVTIPNSDDWYIVSLGVIRIDPAIIGSTEWTGIIQAYAGQSGETVSIDCLYLIPLDDSAGQLTSLGLNNAAVLSVALAAGTGTDTGTGGSNPWVNPQNVGSSVSAGVALTTGSTFLQATGFGFAIPTGATIKGFEISYRCTATKAYGAALRALALVQAGTIITAGQEADSGNAFPVGVTVTRTYGSPHQMWGATWTPAQVNAANFGVALQLVGAGNTVASVGNLTVTAYFTLGSTITVTQDVVLAANGVLQIATDGIARQDPSGAPYAPVSTIIGDLPRLPPSGVESRPCELLIRPSIGDLDTEADSALGDFSAQVMYWPSYLSRP